jgi:hypothetical protein
MDENGECSPQFKRCGDVNGKSKGVCVRESENCPITDIVFGTSNPDAGRFDQTLSGNGVNIYYTRKPVSQPLIETILKESHVCYNTKA